MPAKGAKRGLREFNIFLLRILLLWTLLGKNKTCSQNQEEASEFDGWHGKYLSKPGTSIMNKRSDNSTTTNAWKRKKRFLKHNTLRIGTWNTRSWNNKAQEVLAELSFKNIDLCAVSDTKKNGKVVTSYQVYIIFFSGVPNEAIAKGAFCSKENLKVQ